MWITIGLKCKPWANKSKKFNTIPFGEWKQFDLFVLAFMWILKDFFDKRILSFNYKPILSELFVRREWIEQCNERQATWLTITATFESGTNRVFKKMQHFHEITSSGFFFRVVQLVKQWLHRIQKSNLVKIASTAWLKFSKCSFWADRTQFECQSSVQHLYH